MSTAYNQNKPDSMRNDPDNYKWGIFYYNPKEKRCILPKRNKWMGWTFNFANGYTYLIISVIILFAILIGKITGN